MRSGEDGKIYIGAGEAEIIQNNTAGGRTQYQYLGYPVKEELCYPDRIIPGKMCTLSITYEAEDGAAAVSIDNGPVIKFNTARTMGLCYIGLAASKGGDFSVRRIETSLR